MMNSIKILSIAISLMVAVTFVPMAGQADFAYGQNTFSTGGSVTGLVQASASYNSVTIKWSAYSGAQGYEVYRANKKSGKYKKIRTLSGCSFKDNGNKKLGKKKYYKVRAFATVNATKKYSKNSRILKAAPKLGTPSKVTTSGGAGCITVSWNKVAGAKKYLVYRAASRNGKYSKVCTTKGRSYRNTSVTNGKRYFYKVKAYRKSGKKRYSNYSAPVEGMAQLNGVGGFRSVLADDGLVTSSWAGVSGAGGYQLQRATSAGGTYVTISETTSTAVTDKLTESGQYYYRVRPYATVNGKRQYGSFSSGGRTNAVNQARSWVGCKESNGSHKKIINIFNNYNPKCGRIGYSTAWCAAFVSAVAIKTGNTGVIPVDCYCPRMLSNFPNKTKNKKYTPSGGDAVFYDWNKNGVPDHVGMIESVSGDSVTAIEGNYSDAVKRRTFKKGYSYLLAYGLPNYSINNTVSYTAPQTPVDPVVEDADVTNEDIQNALGEIEASEATVKSEADSEETAEAAVETTMAESSEAIAEEPSVKAAEETAEQVSETVSDPAAETADEEPAVVAAEATAEPATETETAEKIIDYITEDTPAENAAAEESKYNAFLVYEICDEMDIEACVVTITEPDGSESSYNEVVLDGELYILDATKDGDILEKYVPEEIN